MHDQNMTYVAMPLISQCRWPPSPDKSLTETMRNILPRGQPPGRASPARVEIAPQFLGGDFHRLLGEYLSPATPWCRAAFLLRNALTPGDTRFRGGRHHGVVPTLVTLCDPPTHPPGAKPHTDLPAANLAEPNLAAGASPSRSSRQPNLHPPPGGPAQPG